MTKNKEIWLLQNKIYEIDWEWDRTEEQLWESMNHQEFIFDLKNSYKGLLAQLEQEEAEAPSAYQKNPKFFLTENDEEDNTGPNLKLPLTKQQLLNLLVVLEENNLFLINNMQEEDQGLEEASKASD